MSKVIMHVDLNYFFVRCEEIKNPKLIDKPVMIGGIGRAGIVSTCSYAARKFGVHSGMPSYRALELCPNIIVLPGDYKFYSLMSHEFFAFARKYTHNIEQTSIDECYLDITNLIKKEKDVMSFLKGFQDGLYKKTQLKCSIGVASTRFLAKMGSDYKKPMGITIIHKRDIVKMLYPLDIGDFYGIGKRSTPKLIAMGVKTIGDLAEFIKDKEASEKMFGRYRLDIEKCLNGTSDDNVYKETSDPKSIGNSMTLMSDTDDEEEIAKAILMLAKEVSERAKREKMRGKTIQLSLKGADFVSHNKSKTIATPSNEYLEIYQVAYNLFIDNFMNLKVRLVGVTLQNLSSLREENVQLSLFDYEKYNDSHDVNLIINKVNRKFNKKVVGKASAILKRK